MITLAQNPGPARKAQNMPFQPSFQKIKVSLHQMINDLLTGLQPLAMQNNNIVLNGVPMGVSMFAEENLLAYVLWNMIVSTLQGRSNECIHVHTLVDNRRTMICVKEAGVYKNTALAAEYRKVQEAAEKIGGQIHFYNDGNETLIAFSFPNHRLAAA